MIYDDIEHFDSGFDIHIALKAYYPSLRSRSEAIAEVHNRICFQCAPSPMGEYQIRHDRFMVFTVLRTVDALDCRFRRKRYLERAISRKVSHIESLGMYACRVDRRPSVCCANAGQILIFGHHVLSQSGGCVKPHQANLGLKRISNSS